MKKKQLECRIVIIHRRDQRIELGMYDPVSSRYEHLGIHGPSKQVIDNAVLGLKTRIEREGHLLTFAEHSE